MIKSRKPDCGAPLKHAGDQNAERNTEMKTNGKEKTFDAVKTMREIRDQLSREIMKMSFTEEKAYLKELIAKGNKTPRRKPLEK